jgi:hypothetical protein
MRLKEMHGYHLREFARTSSVTNAVKEITKTLWLWKSGTKASGPQYVGGLLLYTEEECT